MKPANFTLARTAAALATGAALGLAGISASAQPLDISQAPLANSAGLSVLPNVMFLLDDSGSMEFDTLPDHTERTAQGAERRYLHTVGTCKPKGILTDSGTSSLDNLPSTHCDRVDPPFGAVQHNGIYYNPAYRYLPPVRYDGSSFGNAPNPADCDPFGTNWDCDDWYSINSDYYNNGRTSVNEGSGTQTYDNTNVKQWYGTGSTFDVNTKFPEIVYCTSTAGTVTNPDQCRRNGFSATTTDKSTGVSFRYTTALQARGLTSTHALSSTLPSDTAGGAYPEAAAIHEFTRPFTGSTATVTLNMAYPHGRTSNGTFQIIPRTGTDMDNGTSPVTVNATTANRYQVTYSDTGTTKIAYGSFDLVVNASRATTGSNPKVITVTDAWNHGLHVNDRITVSDVSCTTSPCSFATTDVVIVSVLDAHRFTYRKTSDTSTGGSGKIYYRKSQWFNIPKLRQTNPHYYTIDPVEYCSDAALTTCTLATAPTGSFTYPAPLRYCLTQFDAYRLDAATGNNHAASGSQKARCRKKYEEATGYIYPRYGQFTRKDIVSAGTFNDGDRSKRSDCASVGSNSCSYSEELQNFRNWWQYYRHRMLAMKTAAGVAFLPIDDRFRVGFLTINPMSGDSVSGDNYLRIDQFSTDHKQAWYEKFYDKNNPGGGTPLPEALSRVGRHFAGKTDGINKGMGDDPIEYSCQQNFVIATTDGYWSGRNGDDIDGGSIGNVDNTADRPFYDGGSGAYDPDGSDSTFSTSGTLADVALYYYQNDLRTGSCDVCENNVPTRDDPLSSDSDVSTPSHQHMITFGLGMAEGLMDWREDYESDDADGDFDKVRAGATTGCAWTPTGKCDWPVPGSRDPSNLDDLWHAAVNGRGQFFYARDTKGVQEGLTKALTSLQTRKGSGAAAATSTPNITPTDRGIFRTQYTTVEWYGDITAQFINPNDGTVDPDVAWSAKDKLQEQVGSDTDSRTILMGDYGTSNGWQDFDYDDMDGTEKAWFDDKCSLMAQCSSLDSDDRDDANDGENLVNFLRGRGEHEAELYRDRTFVLGDTVNAVPLYVAKPRYGFTDAVTPNYAKYASDNAGRKKMLYVAANDGMLHALNADTGAEEWAFIPRQLAQHLWNLADDAYATQHRYFVDGSPTFMDVWDGTGWRTIVVGGLNAGGRGYYALDVTNPNAPIALWEFCHDETLCPVADKNLGYSFGTPVIAKNPATGKWVAIVTSGYNNVSPGDGKGYLYILDAITGEIQQTVSTGVGDEETPSGLGRISGWADNFFVDNTAKYVYGGDQEGNVWKFDLTESGVKVTRLGQALGPDGKPQPITSRPELGLVESKYKVLYVGTGRYLGNKDLTDPDTQDPKGEWSWQQSLYAFKDEDEALGSLRDAGLVRQTITELGETTRTISDNKVDWSSDKGWYVDFNPGNASPGERVTVDPQLALGTLIVATNVPLQDASCAVGGDSWVYQFDYDSGTFVYGSENGIVARKETGALTVGMVIYQLQKGSIVGQVQRSDAELKKMDVQTAPGSTPSRRTSWREITPGQ